MKTTNRPAEPTATSLKQSLGNRYELFEALLAAHQDLRPEWKYYGERYGWNLKLFEKKRNLCFIVPRAGELCVAFTFGDKQYEQVMTSGVPDSIKKQLAEAKRYMEGRGVSLLVTKPAHLKTVEQLLCIKRGATST